MAYAPAAPAGAARLPPPPSVEIVEEPVDEYRFRYALECRTNGSIPGEHSVLENKTYPQIKVNNYIGPVKIRVSCVTRDFRPHPHKLVGREGCREGVCTIRTTITEGNRTVQFRYLGIQCVKRNDVNAAMLQRAMLRVDPFRTGFDPTTYKSIDLHHVRLAFQVLIPDAAGHCRVPLRAVASRTIADFRNRLSIVQASLSHGLATGNTQVILLTERLPRDVSVVFCEESTGWQAEATVERSHRQFALVISTPPYRNPNITHPVDVTYYLSAADRRSRSNVCVFTYTPKHSIKDQVKEKSTDRLMQLLADLGEGQSNPVQLKQEMETEIITSANKIVQNDNQQPNTSRMTFQEIPPPEPTFEEREQRWEPVAVAGPSHRGPTWMQTRHQALHLQQEPMPSTSFPPQRHHEPPSPLHIQTFTPQPSPIDHISAALNQQMRLPSMEHFDPGAAGAPGGHRQTQEMPSALGVQMVDHYPDLYGTMGHSSGAPATDVGLLIPGLNEPMSQASYMDHESPEYFFQQEYQEVFRQDELELEEAAVALLQEGSAVPSICELLNLPSDEDMLTDSIGKLTTSSDVDF